MDDPDNFRSRLLNNLSITEEEWESKVVKLRAYRDAFIAHLDSEEKMKIPEMDLPFEMIKYYFNSILEYENQNNIFAGMPKDLDEYYLTHYDEAILRTKI